MQKDDMRRDWQQAKREIQTSIANRRLAHHAEELSTSHGQLPQLLKSVQQLFMSCQQLPYTVENGKTYQMDFADAEIIALLTTRMKS